MYFFILVSFLLIFSTNLLHIKLFFYFIFVIVAFLNILYCRLINLIEYFLLFIETKEDKRIYIYIEPNVYLKINK